MLNHNRKWRGTFFRAFHFARWLVRAGHAVTLVTISDGNRVRFRSESLHGVTVVESPDLFFGIGRTGWDPYDAWRRIGFLRSVGPFDLVHAFDCRPVVIFPALAIAREMRIPFVSDWADWWGRGGIIQERPRILRWALGPIETFFEEHFRTRADGVTVTSRALQDRAAALGVSRGRIRYIPSGADTETIRPMNKRACRRRLGLPEDGPLVEFIGFINYDFDCMLRSFPYVQKRFPDARLLLVGQPSALTGRICKELGISAGIQEVGIVPYEKLAPYLACADVLLLPFTDKICNIGRGPIKLGDYMAAGRPIVTQPVGDLRSLFDLEEPIGLLCGDRPESFGQAVCELLADPARAERYGRNARRLAEDRYSWEMLSGRLEAFYRELV
ncbi:MAG: glycosyltransferase family 4 protein [bacterium]